MKKIERQEYSRLRDRVRLLQPHGPAPRLLYEFAEVFLHRREENMQYDLTKIDFEAFVAFIFDHPVADRRKDEEPWHWAFELEVSFCPVEILHLYTQLFRDPKFLLAKYTREELEQGFWAMQSSTLPCSVTEIIWDDEVEFAAKDACLRSMYHLYEKLFSEDSLETSSFMWWDAIAFNYCCGNVSLEKSEVEAEMQNVIFETLRKILSLDSIDCQTAALHGLGHLRHPDTEAAIKTYLEMNSTLDDETREYALACISGDIQ